MRLLKVFYSEMEEIIIDVLLASRFPLPVVLLLGSLCKRLREDLVYSGWLAKHYALGHVFSRRIYTKRIWNIIGTGLDVARLGYNHRFESYGIKYVRKIIMAPSCIDVEMGMVLPTVRELEIQSPPMQTQSYGEYYCYYNDYVLLDLFPVNSIMKNFPNLQSLKIDCSRFFLGVYGIRRGSDVVKLPYSLHYCIYGPKVGLHGILRMKGYTWYEGDVQIGTWTKGPAFPMPNLKRLELTGRFYLELILSNMPNLEELTLVNVRNPWGFPITIGHLPKLRKLRINSRLRQKIDFSKMPNLREVSITHSTSPLDLRMLEKLEVVTLGKHAGGGRVRLPSYMELTEEESSTTRDFVISTWRRKV